MATVKLDVSNFKDTIKEGNAACNKLKTKTVTNKQPGSILLLILNFRNNFRQVFCTMVWSLQASCSDLGSGLIFFQTFNWTL